jgi:alanyl-tRNA synthetase
MTGNEIREKFLEYFERRGHRRVHSSPLLPANDPTLLFTNAGMNQFKDVFLGNEKRDYVRAVSSQKCVRAGGKHNDLDEVGKTARHHTFFEMLGNFSFGDYFKEDAIKFAWDLLVNEFGLDPKRMWFSVFGGDDEVPADEEAEQLWIKVGVHSERVLRFGRKDNFWQMGETGPCGPCSEIHYYMGDDPNDPENSAAFVNAHGDTIMEIWNLVFMQFDRSETEQGKYKLTPLPAPSVDTGAGLERLAVVMQGVKSNYDTDLIRPIVEFTAQLAGRRYEPETQEGFALRAVADHARATAFSIADGILPAGEGRNYVLRKIMRRAIYHGRFRLGFEGLFFYKVTNFVIDQMKGAYPELEAGRGFIEKMVRLEEERFKNTLTVGLKKLDELFSARSFHDLGKVNEAFQSVVKDLACLYDTFGTPRDLMRLSLEERGFQISEEDFNEAVDSAVRSLQVSDTLTYSKKVKVAKTKSIYIQVAEQVEQSQFKGYETTRDDDAKVVALIKGDEEVNSLNEGDEGEVVLSHTPFYAESGGQVGDVGTLETAANASVEVLDTHSPAQGLIVHKVKVEKGSLKVGDIVSAQVDVEKRDATRRNHTATHLMHAALREVLGTHVKQAGSVVAPNYLRFDFTHYQPLTDSEIEEIENLVNYHILRNEKVETNVMAVEEAMRSGAIALFGEKYGERVRVLSINGDEGIFSKELCGGTHVRATGDIGSFKITSYESIASGTRRIYAVTGAGAFKRFQESDNIIADLTDNLLSSRTELPNVIQKLQDDLKKAKKEVEDLKLKIATGAVGSPSNGNEAREIAGVKVLVREAEGLDSNAMRQLSDALLARIKSGVVVVGRRSGDCKVSLIVRSSDDVKQRVPAGQVIKELAPIVGGRGGGKPDMAEGGGSQPEKLKEALEASYNIIERLLVK